MYSMQAFYTNVFVTKPEGRFEGFLRIAHASLKQILAVRSALAWEVWSEAK